MSKIKVIKNPRWAGLFYYHESLTAQTIVFIAIVSVTDNNADYSGVTFPAAGPLAPFSMVKETC